MMLDSFAAYLSEELDRREGTVNQYRYRLHFATEHTGKPLPEITTADMRELKKALKDRYASSTIKGVIVAWRHFRYWGSLEGLWTLNGEVALKAPPEENDSSPPLPLDQVKELLAAWKGSLECRVVHLPAYAGLRIGSAAIVDDEIWQNEWLRFRGKGRRFQEIPVHPRLERVRGIIMAHPNPHKDSLPDAKERIEERVGFHFVVHQLRKTFSTCLHDGGVSHLCRRELLGHKTGLDGTYTLVSCREKKEAVFTLPY